MAANTRLPALIFDFGGVVFRWRPAALLAQVLPELAGTPDLAERWKALFFQGYAGEWGEFDSGLIDVPTLCVRMAGRTGLSEAQVLAVVNAIPAELAPQPGTVALMAQLKAVGHRLFYLSNMPAPYAEHLERSHAFMADFSDGVFSSRVKTGKPGERIYRIALDQFGLQPHEALFIDDHPENIRAAQAIGLPALLFTSADQLALDLRARGLLPADVPAPAATGAPN
jgi:putative hydrolase of the HAD superfamily